MPIGVGVAEAIGVGLFVGVGVGSASSANVAVTSVVWVILIEHSSVPVQLPVQPVNVPVLIAVAERVMAESGK